MSWSFFRSISSVFEIFRPLFSKTLDRKRKLSDSDSEDEDKNSRKRRMWNEEEDARALGFAGKIYYESDYERCASIGAEILKHINKTNDTVVIGFDSKYHYNTEIGSDYTAVLSFCYDSETCYIFQIYNLSVIPRSITDCLIHPKVKLTGYCIDLQIRKLFLENPHIDMDLILPHCVELEELVNKISPRKHKWGLPRLVHYFLRRRISDDKAINYGRWDKLPLSDSQKRRAVSDVVACLLLYHHLKRIEALQRPQN